MSFNNDDADSELLKLYMADRYNTSRDPSIPISESEARILHNIVYQKTQYFPYRNQMIWQNKEVDQQQQLMYEHYREIRDKFKS